ncbi:MAG: cytochrome P460 family protein [Alphaproteobacteria bacterium]|nr:cytochrome P460 family protein [Alphaproteobacteria bacterium]
MNKIGRGAYTKYDDKDSKMPIGTTVAKPSFVVQPTGKVALGPLFLMEKMTRGFNAATANWRYAMVMPGGKLFGMTGSKNSAGLKFCHDCHVGGEDNDYMLFLPEEVRK